MARRLQSALVMDALRVLGQRISDGPAVAFFILMLALIVGPRVTERVRLPAMVGLVLAGMLVGPHGIKILATDEIALSAWGNFGLLYLMFAAGLELDLKLFARMKKAAQRSLKDRAEEWLARDGLESKTLFRVSRSVPAGILQAIRSEKATLLLAEWRSEARNRVETNAESFRMLSRSPIPVLVASGSLEPFERLVVVARREDLVVPGRLDLELAAEVAARLSGRHPVLFVTTSATAMPGLFGAKKVHPQAIEVADPLGWVHENTSESDLLLLPGIDAAHEALERSPWLSGRKFFVAIAAHGAAAPARESSGGLVVGRSLTEAGAS